MDRVTRIHAVGMPRDTDAGAPVGAYDKVFDYKVDLNHDGKLDTFSVRETTSYAFKKSALGFWSDFFQGKATAVTDNTYVARSTSIAVVALHPDHSMYVKNFSVPAEMSLKKFDADGPMPAYHGINLSSVGAAVYVQVRVGDNPDADPLLINIQNLISP